MKKSEQVSEKTPTANRQYKDTVFRMLFSEKENLLSLYNAVTGSHYQNAEALKIVTLENAIYMGCLLYTSILSGIVFSLYIVINAYSADIDHYI